jgi:hypothetical protein
MQIIDQQTRHVRKVHFSGGLDYLQSYPAQVIHTPLQSRQQVFEKLRQFVVGLFEPDPSDRPAEFFQPQSNRRRFSLAGRGRN